MDDCGSLLRATGDFVVYQILNHSLLRSGGKAGCSSLAGLTCRNWIFISKANFGFLIDIMD
jgi:hypothetical protein